MSRMSELSQILDELTACGESMVKAAAALRSFYSAEEPDTQPSETAASENQSLEKGKSEGQNPVASSPKAETPAISFTDVRKAFADKAHAGYTEQVKALIAKHGADRLSGISEEEFPELMAELEAIQ